MLVLNRKIGERIKVGDDITLTVIAIDRFGARLGLDAPRGVTILRGELVEAPSLSNDPIGRHVVPPG